MISRRTWPRRGRGGHFPQSGPQRGWQCRRLRKFGRMGRAAIGRRRQREPWMGWEGGREPSSPSTAAVDEAPQHVRRDITAGRCPLRPTRPRRRTAVKNVVDNEATGKGEQGGGCGTRDGLRRTSPPRMQPQRALGEGGGARRRVAADERRRTTAVAPAWTTLEHIAAAGTRAGQLGHAVGVFPVAGGSLGRRSL